MGAADRLPLTRCATEDAKPTDRLFFAVFPPPEVASFIASSAQRVQSEFGLTGKLLAADRLHATLYYLGDHVGVRRDIVDSAMAAASEIAAQPFDVCLDHVTSFSARARNRPCVLLGNGPGIEPLKAFQRELGTAMKRASLGRWAEGNFEPHVTLLYDDRPVADHPVAPICWTVREFVLVRSLIGKKKHIVLGRWPLLSREGKP